MLVKNNRISRRIFIGGVIVMLSYFLAERTGLMRLFQSYAPRPKRQISPEDMSKYSNRINSQLRQGLIEQAESVLRKNTLIGKTNVDAGEFEYLYVRPAIPKYPHQWLWDSSFHVIVMCRYFNKESAKRELASLLKGIHADGLLPSIVYWDGVNTWFEGIMNSIAGYGGNSTNLTQPPMVAVALQELFDSTRDETLLKQLLPIVEKYFDWLANYRDPDQDHLISIVHPWEGLDASPVFDPILGLSSPQVWEFYSKVYGLLLKYASMNWDNRAIVASNAFNVEYLVFNCIYAQGLRAIGRMRNALGDKNQGQLYDAKADRVEESIYKLCWDDQDQIFYDIRGNDHKFIRVKSVSSIFPIILDKIPERMLAPLVERHLTNENEFWTTFPIPSVAKSEVTFNPNDAPLTWRGPTWININWLIVQGLGKHGYSDVAQEIARRSIALVDQSGYWEFYNPITGEAGGQPDYSWSTLAIDFLALLGPQ